MSSTTEKKVDDLHASIGRFVLAWVEVELYLDVLAVVSQRGSLRSEITLGQDLSEKIKLIRTEVVSDPRLSLYRSIIERAIDKIHVLSDYRHDYVQNAALKYTIGTRGLNAIMVRPVQLSNKPRRSTVKVTASLVNKITDQLDVISGKLLDVAEAVEQMRGWNHVTRLTD